ncbi:MAG: thioredoxin family protein [Chloroflexi bacterium]|nr:thioredoxin family protein [Chloroflexota bacterium]
MKQSVVTEERFSSGLIYSDYIAGIKVNKEQFENNYHIFTLTTEETDFFRKAAGIPGGVARILVLGEDWCPDVVRGMPVIARIAEAASIDLKVFPRDQHLDIINEFLNQGQFMSVPTVVLYTKDLRVIGVWHERPKIADKERARIEGEVKAQMVDAGEQEIRAAVRERMSAMNQAFQRATVGEIRELLAAKLGM